MIAVVVQNMTGDVLYSSQHEPEESFSNLGEQIVGKSRTEHFVFCLKGKDFGECMFCISPKDAGFGRDVFDRTSTGSIKDVTLGNMLRRYDANILTELGCANVIFFFCVTCMSM